MIAAAIRFTSRQAARTFTETVEGLHDTYRDGNELNRAKPFRRLGEALDHMFRTGEGDLAAFIPSDLIDVARFARGNCLDEAVELSDRDIAIAALRGHERPPQQRRLPIEDGQVQHLLAQLATLRNKAVAQCNGQLTAFTHHNPVLYAPSRLAKWPTGRQQLQRVASAAWPAAIGSRLAQMRRIERKLERICKDWRHLTDEELVQPPLYDGATSCIYDSWSPHLLVKLQRGDLS